MTTEGTDDRPLSAAVAEEIRALMARRRMSARQLAATMRVSHAYVSYRLAGKKPINLDDLDRIAAILGVAVADLLPADTKRPIPGRGDIVGGAERTRRNQPDSPPGTVGRMSARGQPPPMTFMPGTGERAAAALPFPTPATW